MSSKEEGFFTVAEDEILEQANEQEMISVAEDEGLAPQPGVALHVMPQDGAGGAPTQEEEKEDVNWLSSGKPKHFMVFLVNEMKRFPNPNDVVGNASKIEQALGQWKRLNSHCSRALRGDYDGEIDVGLVDKARTLIEQHVERLEDMLDGMNRLKQNRRQLRRRRGDDEQDGLTKEGASPAFYGFQINITPFQAALARAFINGVVSSGRNMDEMWEAMKKKYKLNDRDELEMVQVLYDMGYPEFKDRLRIGEETDDPSRTKGYGEWMSNYYA
jgi:hypothetical protein